MAPRSSTARRSPPSVRERGDARGRGVPSAGDAPGPRDGARRRRPRLADLRAQQAARPARRSGIRVVRPRAPRRHVRRTSSLELLERAERRRRVNGILLQLPAAGPHRPGASSSALIDPRKDVDGLTPTNAGLLVQGRDGRSCRARRPGVMELLDDAGARARGRRGGRRRALEPGRQAAGVAAARRERDRDRSATRARATSPRSAAAADVLVAAVGQAAARHGRHGQARARP